MRRVLIYLCLLGGTIGFTSCRTFSPQLNYQKLARASILLGVDIDLKDNHKLYLESSGWIGVPYRGGGDSKRGTDCSGLAYQIYRKVYQTRLPRSSEELKSKSSKVTKRNLKEGDFVFFSSARSGKKVGHVGIYLKEGKFIHASTGKGVIVSSLDEKYYKERWISGGRML